MPRLTEEEIELLQECIEMFDNTHSYNCELYQEVNMCLMRVNVVVHPSY
jgi:hypothetical protein